MDKEIKWAVGADVGGSHISSAVVNLGNGEMMTNPIVTEVDCQASANTVVNAWCLNLKETLKVFTGKIIAPVKICMAIPGPFDYRHGISFIRGVNKFDNLYGLDVKRAIEDRMGVEVSFVNDAAAFALGEALGGNGQNSEKILALTLGTGVGSGFVRNCRLIETDDSVPEKGWVYNLPFEGSIADDAFSTRWIVGRYEELTGKRLPGAREVADCCGRDSNAAKVFYEFGNRLARFVIPLMDRFGTSTIVLGGNISRSLNLFQPAMEEVFSKEGRIITILPTALFDRAALIGAAATIM